MIQAGVNDTSVISQSGQNGYVKVSQQGTGINNSSITQIGADNNQLSSGLVPDGSTSGLKVYGGVNIDQSGASNNTSYVYQYSDMSGVSVTQNGTGGTNSSIATQNTGGSGNFAAVIQTAAAGLTNTSNITQGGTGNLAYVKQH